MSRILLQIFIIINLIHGLGHLTSSGIDALPSFLGASSVSKAVHLVFEYFGFIGGGYKPVSKTPIFGGPVFSLSLPSLLRSARLGRPYQEHKFQPA